MHEWDAIVARCARGEISAAVALAELLMTKSDRGTLRAYLDAARGAAPIARLLEVHEAGVARVAAVVDAGIDVAPAGRAEATIAAQRALFDRAVERSEEASVALYSLGSPELLAAATAEIVRALDEWRLLGATKTVVDLGCGIGRVAAAIGPRVRAVRGLDVSPKMIEAARRRCAHLPNVTLACTDGRDLAALEDDAFDLVLAVDSFPYVVQAGDVVVEAHVAGAARALRRGGELVVFNFSYRGDPARDRADAARLAAAHGLELIEAGGRPFTLWNGAAFRWRKAGAGAAAGRR